MYTLELYKKNLVSMPKWLPHNIHYETIMGSVAYGVSSDTSDMDVYGFSIPPKEMIFPHLAGKIQGFGSNVPTFEQFQKHGIIDESALGGKGRIYDLTIYGIVRYFQLLMENNPNMIDSIFTPESCVLHITRIGQIVRDNRRLFLHKGCWNTFRGYAYSQLHKIQSKNHDGLNELMEFEKSKGISNKTKFLEVKEALDQKKPESFCLNTFDELQEYYNLYSNTLSKSKRSERVKIDGFDVKFAYHVVRLIYEAEMILSECDLNLQRNREHLKAIRRGELTEEDIRDFFNSKSKILDELHANCKLPPSPQEDKIKNLLLNCLEEHYGKLDNCLVIPDRYLQCLREIKEKIEGVL